MITRNFNLFLNAGNSIPLVINVNQFDSGEQWVFTLFNSDGTQYIPSTGAIVGIKSDGLGIINSGSVNESGQVVISETQQMTAAVGKAVFELMIDNQTHGTANFVVLVEEKPGNNADLSESDLSLLEEAISATSPLPTGGTVGQVLTKTANGSTWSDAGTPTQEQVADAVSDWADEHITVTTGVVIDDSLSVAGAAADAKATGDELADLKSAVQSGMKESIKQALLALADAVGYNDEAEGEAVRSQLYNALYSVALVSISAVYDRGEGLIFTCDTLDSLKENLTVTAHYDNGTSAEIDSYTLSGELTAGDSVINVSYSGKSTTFTVTGVIAGTDITPALSSFPASDSKARSTVIGDSIRVYSASAGTYTAVRTALPTLKSGYTYQISYDADYVSGAFRIGIVNASNDNSMFNVPTPASTASGSFIGAQIPSEKSAWNTSALLSIFCTWSTSALGDVTISNLRVIEYLAE